MLKGWKNCAEHHVFVYLFSLIGINGITILTCFLLALASARGSILEPHKRHYVGKFVYIRMPLFICEIGIVTASTILAYSKLKLNL